VAVASRTVIAFMVPVQLELQNFLSYGTEAPPLRFDEFEVACLSGGNGEGKSALLDAMTWAIWGEARKSSGRRKPDDELIRIGTGHMEVTFTFDLEGVRYRVTRSFSRSATGKTTSSNLEFQIYDEDEDAYRPLTGATQRETQSRIDDALGLDYDTFINSAFLLQGRSDEFTQKSPSQRKEILVRILNLSRYETLEDRARDRWRAAKERQRRAEVEVERLEEALSDVPDWKAERETVQDAIEEQREVLSTLREEKNAITESIANLEAKAREAETLQSTIEDLDDRIDEHESEIERLRERIAEADDLLSGREAIESAYERYETLKEERDRLEETRDVHRKIEKQIEEKEAILKERRNELERRLDRLKVERESLRQSLDEAESTLAKRSGVEAHLRSAQAARQSVRELEMVKERREYWAQEEAEAERALVGVRQQLRGELESLRTQVANERETLDERDALKERVDTLEAEKERRDKLSEEMQRVESEGRSLTQVIQERSGQLQARRKERDRAEAELERLQATAEGSTCPTCGSELTPEHRAEVAASLQSDLENVVSDIEQEEELLSEKRDRRDALRQKYASLHEQVSELDGVEEALATTREQLRSLEETASRLEKHKQKAERLQQRLERGMFGGEHRRRWQLCRQRRAGLPFDPERYERLQNRAAQVGRYRDRLRDLEAAAGRREKLRRKLSDREDEIQSSRQKLDGEETFADLKEEIDRLRDRLDEVAFDPDRFQEVRAALDDLGDAPSRLSNLQHAMSNRSDWIEQRAREENRLGDAQEERAAANEALAALRSELEEREALDDRKNEKQKAAEKAENELNSLQQRLGMLNERLEQAQADRESLSEAESKRESAKEDRELYKHLRTAFGKHGIPSLIIEETLPDIEERANRILDRLTDGRMHVRLETLQEKKSGGTKETLEVTITDEQGVPRPYETFSGGESFRVNFALRVALAQLLAERSGVRVRTLVIDEGFGTQDADGIERLVDAIQAIREDFAKILVITHLERLKQAFPVRIEVEKDPAVGSTFELVGV